MSGTDGRRGTVSTRRRPWSLSNRLVVGTAAVVAAVLATVGVVSIVTLSSSVTQVVDTQLGGSMSALSYSVEKFHYGNSPSGQIHADKPLTEFTGHGPGAIIATASDGRITDSARFSDTDAEALPPSAVAELEQNALTSGSSESIVLDGFGHYRFSTETDSEGNLLIAGVSLAAADASVLQQTIITVALAMLALLVIVVGLIVVVRLALRPLGRVVGTAVEVTNLPLDRGEVEITTRVGEADTDPRTEVGKVGEALNRLISHVDEALAVRAATDKRMRRFVTDASHELRTPLAAIQGYAELTRQENAELPDITEYSLARIESEAKRMNSLVSDLLLLARLDEGQDLHLDQVDLAEIVVNAVSDAKAMSAAHTWLHEVPDAPALVSGDRERLHQVVLNLLSNAALHTPDGTTVTAGLRFAEHDGAPAIELTVRDDGPGIDPDLVPELFERFARGDSSRSRRSGSTGLGLAIVASIVEAHDGAIDVTSSPEGTVFTLCFARVAGATAGPLGERPVVREDARRQ
ncbi:sensor histidine kinase [Herbiconiux sp. P15]|uniref:sensor histidine kinase n=1 Tax=Herbiconiux liukaitaii TaxID=3342799 RepID=UPI0035B781A8